MKRRNTFKVPNRLIRDDRLSPSARKLGAVFFAHRNALGYCRKSLDALSGLSGLCPATVRKCVEELSALGYIAAARTCRYLERRGRSVYGQTEYRVALDFEDGYTLIPRELLLRQRGLTPSAFLLCLCLLMAAGNSRRAFPSISRLAQLAGVARSTVCRALLQLKAVPWLLVQLCRRRRGDFAASSYHFVTVQSEAQPVQAPTPIPEADAPEIGEPKPVGILHTLIVRVRRALRKLFSREGVVPFLANYS